MNSATSKQAIIIGASSGIGEALARHYAAQGYDVGLMARREPLLRELAAKLPTKSWVKVCDISHDREAAEALRALLAEMGNVDHIVINSGVFNTNREFSYEKEAATIAVNIVGFTAMANVAYHHCKARGRGAIVGISSIIALRGIGKHPAYSASKAFVSNYLEGMRAKAFKECPAVAIVDVRPGYVATPLIAGNDRAFWVASPEKAAMQIYDAVQARRSRVYVTRRWVFMAWFMRMVPDFMYLRLLS